MITIVANREAVALRKQIDPSCGLGDPRSSADVAGLLKLQGSATTSVRYLDPMSECFSINRLLSTEYDTGQSR